MTSPRLFKPAILKNNMTELELYRMVMKLIQNLGSLAMYLETNQINANMLHDILQRMYERFKIEYGIESILELNRHQIGAMIDADEEAWFHYLNNDDSENEYLARLL